MDILFSCNTNYVGPTKVFLYSVCKSNAEHEVDFWFVYHDMTQEGIGELQRVINLFPRKRLHLLDVGGEFLKDVKLDFLSIETFYRIKAIDMLPADLHRILYLDVDMVVKGDLSELFTISLEGHPIAACEDMNAKIASVDVHTSSKVPSDMAYFNAGMLLMNLDYLREHNLGEKLVNRILNEYKNFFYYDQDILNNEFYDTVLILPFIYNLHPKLYFLDLYSVPTNKYRYATVYQINERCEDFDRRYKDITDIVIEKGKIIHYISDSKPWKHRGEEMYWVHAMYKDFWFDCEREVEEALK